MAFIRLLVRDCCGAQAEQRQALGNHLLTTQGIQPHGYWTLDMPVISGWRYYDAVGARNDALVSDMIVAEWNGNFTDYAIAEVDASVIAADGSLIGRIEIDVECRDVCNSLENKGFWQIEGKAMEPYRPPGTAWFSTDCGYTSALGSSYSWSLPEGETATIVAEGGRGSNRHFFTDNLKVKGISQGGGTFSINGFNGGVNGLDPDLEFTDEAFVVRLQQAGLPYLMEKNLRLDELPQITIKGIETGRSFLYCTDGVACTWGMFIHVDCNFCGTSSSELWGSEATATASEGLQKRGDDFSIKTKGGAGWCPCFDAEETTSTLDINVLGAYEPVMNSLRNSQLLGGGLLAAEGAGLRSGNLFIKKSGQDKHVFKNPPKNFTVNVGESIEIEVPLAFRTNGEGNDVIWGYRILPVPLLPSEGQDPLDVWGAGWGFGNTGPMTAFSNDDKSMWKVTKRKGSLKMEALAPTNYLPTFVQLYRKGGGLGAQSDAQHNVAPSMLEQCVLSVGDTASGTLQVRKWDQYAVGGSAVISTQYINVERSDAGSPNGTTCSLWFTINSFCPEGNWDIQQINDQKVSVKFSTDTDKGQLWFFSPKENEDYGIFADSNNYYRPDDSGDDYSQKDIELADPPPNKPYTNLIDGASIFAIWTPYPENRTDHRNPYYNPTDLNRGLIDDGSTFSQVILKHNGATIGLAGATHSAGDKKEDIKGDFQDKWLGLYEPLRGCMCSWGTTFAARESSALAVGKKDAAGKVKDIYLMSEKRGNNRLDP